jgi:hypothetical protein
MLECPYCNCEINELEELNPSDNECECPFCGKIFLFDVEWNPAFYPRKAPCLNGGEHFFVRMPGVGDEIKQCTVCFFIERPKTPQI